MIALMSASWSVSVLIGPLIGGTFAQCGGWRTAFVATTITAGGLATGAFFVLPSVPSATGRTPASPVPAGRVTLICLAICRNVLGVGCRVGPCDGALLPFSYRRAVMSLLAEVRSRGARPCGGMDERIASIGNG
jgi:predicted MFS family arabinose efflux permease